MKQECAVHKGEIVEIEERNGNLYVKGLLDKKCKPEDGLYIIGGQILTWEEFKKFVKKETKKTK